MVKSLVWQVQYVDLYTLQIYTSVDICGCGWCDEGPADMRAGAADSVHEHLQSQVLCAAASPTAMPRPSRTGRQPGQEDPWSMQSSRSHWPAWSRQNVLPLRRRACLLSANETLEHYHPRSTIAIFELIRPFDHTMIPWKFRGDRPISNGSWVILLTNRQTDTQTDTTENNTTVAERLVKKMVHQWMNEMNAFWHLHLC